MSDGDKLDSWFLVYSSINGRRQYFFQGGRWWAARKLALKLTLKSVKIHLHDLCNIRYTTLFLFFNFEFFTKIQL